MASDETELPTVGKCSFVSGSVRAVISFNGVDYQVEGKRIYQYQIWKLERDGSSVLLHERGAVIPADHFRFWNPVHSGIIWNEQTSSFALKVLLNQGTQTKPEWEEVRYLQPADWPERVTA